MRKARAERRAPTMHANSWEKGSRDLSEIHRTPGSNWAPFCRICRQCGRRRTRTHDIDSKFLRPALALAAMPTGMRLDPYPYPYITSWMPFVAIRTSPVTSWDLDPLITRSLVLYSCRELTKLNSIEDAEKNGLKARTLMCAAFSSKLHRLLAEYLCETTRPWPLRDRKLNLELVPPAKRRSGESEHWHQWKS